MAFRPEYGELRCRGRTAHAEKERIVGDHPSAQRAPEGLRMSCSRLYLRVRPQLSARVPGFIVIPFVLRALDWLRAAISALLETCMRRLGLVGWAAADSVFAACLGEAPRAPFRPTLTEICCSKRWYCGLRFPVDFSAAAWLARTIATAFVSDDGSKFGRARPSARCDVRPAPKLRPGDGHHPATPRRAPEPLALQFERDRRAARQK